MPGKLPVLDRRQTAAFLSQGSDTVKPVQPEMSAELMRAYLTEVGSILAARGLTGELV